MHKLLYFATIGLLAFSIGGCGGEGSDTASPSSQPTLGPGAASPSPAAGAPAGASASPTPAAQTFQSPIVAAQPPGLIQIDQPRRTGETGSNRHRRQQEQESHAESSAGADRPFDSQSFSGRPLWASAADRITNPFGSQRRRWDDLSTTQTATARSSRPTHTAPSGSPPNWSARSRY
jgi:hypothetical protein